jgi:serine/threonine protein kinase
MDSMTNWAMPAHLKPAYRRNFMRAFGCLSNALAHIHQNGVKHMDIKPRNILVKHRHREDPMAGNEIDLRFYITDFDIARPIRDPGHSRTNGQTGLSFLYCAPEVATQDETSRGRSADIFSMGCVMLEMIGVVLDESPLNALCYRYKNNKSFHDNLERVYKWIRFLRGKAPAENLWPIASNDTGFNTIRDMLDADPDCRPKATDLERRCFGSNNCCREPPETILATHETPGDADRSCRLVLP